MVNVRDDDYIVDGIGLYRVIIDFGFCHSRHDMEQHNRTPCETGRTQDKTWITTCDIGHPIKVSRRQCQCHEYIDWRVFIKHREGCDIDPPTLVMTF